MYHTRPPPAPFTPAIPVGPDGPDGPVRPVGPVGPVGPVPTVPVVPVNPVGPSWVFITWVTVRMMEGIAGMLLDGRACICACVSVDTAISSK